MQALVSANKVAAAAHLVSALVVIWAYNHWPASKDRASVKAFRNQLAAPDTPDACNTAEDTAPTPDQCNVEITFQRPKATMSVNIVVGAVAFFLITFAAHMWYATLGFAQYKNAVASGWNPFRWFEYAMSAGIMTVLVGLVDGTRDTTALMGLYGITVGMMLTGFITESLLRGRGPVPTASRDAILGSGAVGWILFATLWGVLFYSFATLVSDVNTLYKDEVDGDGRPIKVPSWIWYIVIMQFVYYALFGVVQFLHVRDRLSGNAFDYVNVEKRYIQLSYWSKLSLASGLAYGLIWRTKDCPVS